MLYFLENYIFVTERMTSGFLPDYVTVDKTRHFLVWRYLLRYQDEFEHNLPPLTCEDTLGTVGK